VLLLEEVLVFVPQVHDAGHVHLVVGGEHGGGILRVLEAAGDGLAQARHLHALLARRVLGGDGRAGEGGRFGGGGGFRRGGGAGHILLHHAAVAAGAFDLFAREAGLGHRLLRGGRILHVAARRRRLGAGVGLRGGGARRGLGLLFLGSGRGARAFGDGGEERVDSHGFAFGGDDFAQGPGGGGGDLHGHLVGFQFAEHLVERHLVARLLEPGRDGRLGDAFPERGDADFDAHVSSLPSSALHSRAPAVVPCGWTRARWRARPRPGGPRRRAA
jgi:hypothetical protein